MTKKVMSLLWMVAIVAGIAAHAQSIVPQKDEKKGLWGYVSKSDGKWVVKPKFDEATELTTTPNGQLRGTVTQKGKKGFVDDSGKILGAGVVFEEITPMQGDAMFVKVKGKTGVADYNGVYKVKPEIIDVSELSGEGYIANMKGKKGFLNYDGSWMLEPIYNEIDPSLDGYFLVNKGGKAGIANREGKMLLTPADFSGVEIFGDYWKVMKGKKVGLYNLKDNSLLIKPEYYDVKQPLFYPNGYTLYIISDKPGKWGAMTAQGKNVVKKNFSNIVPINAINALLLFEGPQPKRIFFAGDKKPYKVKNFSKNPIQSGFSKLSFTYNKDWTDHNVELLELPNGDAIEGGWNQIKKINQFLVCNSNGKTIFFKDGGGETILEMPAVNPVSFNNWTLAGKVVISPKNEIFKDFTYDGNSLLINVENKNYIALPNGKLSSIPVDEAKSIGNNLLSAKQGNTAYLLAYDGDILTKGDYDQYVFEGGLVKTVKKGKKGVIDNKTYETILPPEYDDIAYFGNDLYMIKNDSKCGLFNRASGNWYLNPEYDGIEKYGDNLYMIKRDSKCGLFNTATDKWYLNPVYDKITRQEKNEERAEFYDGDKFGIIDLSSGNILLPVERGYQEIKKSQDGQYYVMKNGKWGVASDSFSELISPVYDDIKHSRGMYVATKGNSTHYFEDNGKAIPATPKITFSGYTDHGKTTGGYNATFINYDINMKFCEGKSYTLYANLYTQNGKIARDKWGSPVIRETKIRPDDIDFHEDAYWTLSKDQCQIPYGKYRQDFYVTFKLVDNATGKTVPLPGAKKLTFYWHRN